MKVVEAKAIVSNSTYCRADENLRLERGFFWSSAVLAIGVACFRQASGNELYA